jgi:hypothetical protein
VGLRARWVDYTLTSTLLYGVDAKVMVVILVFDETTFSHEVRLMR